MGIIPLIFIKILVQFPNFPNPWLEGLCNLVVIIVRQYGNSFVSVYAHDCLNAIYISSAGV